LKDTLYIGRIILSNIVYIVLQIITPILSKLFSDAKSVDCGLGLFFCDVPIIMKNQLIVHILFIFFLFALYFNLERFKIKFKNVLLSAILVPIPIALIFLFAYILSGSARVYLMNISLISILTYFGFIVILSLDYKKFVKIVRNWL